MNSRDRTIALQGKLKTVDAAIAAHPLSCEPITSAHAIIEAHSRDDKKLVERELAAQGLPGLAELGRIQVRSSYSWWKLHRQRNAIVKRISRDTSV